MPFSRRRSESQGRESRLSRPPLPVAERRLLAIFIVQLILAPWAIGTRDAWSQTTMLGLGLMALLLALLPRISDAASGLDRSNRSGWSRLRRFPIFWLGLALVAYITIQLCNPQWIYRTNGSWWWIERIDFISWLPAGVSVPFERYGMARELILTSAAWVTACAAWAGLTRRRSLRILLGVTAVNVLAVAALVWFQQITAQPYVPWSERILVGPFVYKNHVGAFMTLAAFALLALAAIADDRVQRGSAKSSPALLWIFGVLVVGGAVMLTLSRAATLLLGVGVIAAIVWHGLRRLRRPSGRSPWLALVPAGLAGGFAIYAGANLDFSRALAGFNRIILQREAEYSIASREIVREATLEMAADYRWYGIGGGAFRHLFPQYARHHPLIYETPAGRRLVWEYAHNDWVEWLAELGIVGFSLIAVGLLWWARWLWRRRKAWSTPWLLLLLGVVQTMIHAGYDFPFQSGGVLITWVILAVVASRGLDLEWRGD